MTNWQSSDPKLTTGPQVDENTQDKAPRQDLDYSSQNQSLLVLRFESLLQMHEVEQKPREEIAKKARKGEDICRIY